MKIYFVAYNSTLNKISADSFMELFCLNFSHPLRVVCDCIEADLEALKRDLARFVVGN